MKSTHSVLPMTPPACGIKIGYLCGQYPMLSMIFVIREVVELRRQGYDVAVASINDPDRVEDQMTAVEATEARSTYYVKRHGAVGAAGAHLQALLRRPGRYLAGWALALRLARWSLLALLKNVVYFTEALMVGRWMQAQGLGHLHGHLGSQVATVGLFVKTVFATGYSVTVHGPDEFYDARGQFLREKCERADFIVAISYFARSQLMFVSDHVHWSKFVVCRLGVDPGVFRAISRERAAGRPFHVLSIGRITPAKGQYQLVEAAQQLVLQGLDFRMTIVGAGPDLDGIRALVHRLGLADRISLPGPVNQDRIRSFYEDADCFCLPSFAEGIPVVFMEAMSSQLPVVTTHITGVPELIEHGVDGLLFAPSDVSGMTQQLARLIRSPELAIELGRAGRRKVLAQYELATNVAALADIFRARLAAPAAGGRS